MHHSTFRFSVNTFSIIMYLLRRPGRLMVEVYKITGTASIKFKPGTFCCVPHQIFCQLSNEGKNIHLLRVPFVLPLRWKLKKKKKRRIFTKLRWAEIALVWSSKRLTVCLQPINDSSLFANGFNSTTGMQKNASLHRPSGFNVRRLRFRLVFLIRFLMIQTYSINGTWTLYTLWSNTVTHRQLQCISLNVLKCPTHTGAHIHCPLPLSSSITAA